MRAGDVLIKSVLYYGKKIQQEKLKFILHVTGPMQGVFSLF